MSQDLARRAIACRHWRWMPGMLVRYPTGYHERIEDDTDAAARLEDDGLPDFTDPATLGCLLALVREAWGRPTLVAYYAALESGQGWYVAYRFCGDIDFPVVAAPSDTEAEALVAALEAAP